MPPIEPLHPAVARARVAVRAALAEHVAAGDTVLVALSGGADSLALAAAVAFEARHARVRAGSITVDHALQPGSTEIAQAAADTAHRLGLDPVLVERVTVTDTGDGPEGAARAARYRAFELAREQARPETRDGSGGAGAAVWIMTAHTQNDQAEQVLLALARGSGTRAIAGIAPRRGTFLRPFLDMTRADTEAACLAQHLSPWIDPHNSDPVYTRARVRHSVLPELEAALGPGVRPGLARSAALARQDADALDAIAAHTRDGARRESSEGNGEALDVALLADVHPAIATRVIRMHAQALTGRPLTHTHTQAVLALITRWRGQGPVHVPGLRVWRTGELIHFTRS